MKQIIMLLFVFTFLAGCSQPQTDESLISENGQGSLRVIASVFPQYDFVRQIAGDRVELSMLISPGGEPHAFEPSPRDIIALNNADLIVYVGGHGEAWVDMILDSLDQPNLQRVALVDLVDVIHEHEHSHGHDDHHEHEHSHGHDDHHEHEHSHGEFDEHVWTSPRNAISIVRALTDILTELDPDNANYFRENSEVFILELEELDRAFAEVVAEGNRSTVIFGDRFPFRYLMNAYGLNYYAAFPGCSAETQASPATIAFLIDKVNAESIPVVFYTEFSARMIANVIVEATGARPFELHSAHNVSHADFIGGVTYLDIMRQNLEQLREALN